MHVCVILASSIKKFAFSFKIQKTINKTKGPAVLVISVDVKHKL